MINLQNVFLKKKERDGFKLWSYRELFREKERLEKALDWLPENGLVAIWGGRCLASYAAILMSVTKEIPFLCLNPRWPLERVEEILRIAGPTVLIFDSSQKISGGVPHEERLRIANVLMVPYFDFAQDMLIFDGNINKPRRVFGGPKKEKISYFVATSGTSGKPKLAALSVKNLLSYREAITSIRSLNSSDCLAQTFELGFDVGLGDFLSCLDVGASLLPIDREDVWCMNRVIREASATALSSSPSAAWLNIELGDREPAPSLRATYFLGEPLTNTLCKRWKDRAPNGEIYNLYGPSETTISVAHCRWNQQEQQGDAVPIGFLHVNHQAKEIVQNAQSSRHVSKDVVVREGELVIKGPQVFSGYLTESGWTTGCGLKEGGWYHTGDTVRVLPDGSFVFLSRCDGQIKIGGQRFELEEIEIRLQASLGVRIVAVVREFGNHKKIAAITTSEIAEESIDRAMLSLHKVVPEVFIPREVIRVTSLPMNDNGKVDRLEAAKLIECQAEVLWRI